MTSNNCFINKVSFESVTFLIITAQVSCSRYVNYLTTMKIDTNYAFMQFAQSSLQSQFPTLHINESTSFFVFFHLNMISFVSSTTVNTTSQSFLSPLCSIIYNLPHFRFLSALISRSSWDWSESKHDSPLWSNSSLNQLFEHLTTFLDPVPTYWSNIKHKKISYSCCQLFAQVKGLIWNDGYCTSRTNLYQYPTQLVSEFPWFHMSVNKQSKQLVHIINLPREIFPTAHALLFSDDLTRIWIFWQESHGSGGEWNFNVDNIFISFRIMIRRASDKSRFESSHENFFFIDTFEVDKLKLFFSEKSFS